METIILYTYGFIVIITILLWLIPIKKIKAIAGFLKIVLPRIPLADIVKAFRKRGGV